MPIGSHGIIYKHTWCPTDVRKLWQTFTKLFLSNIINHDESDEKLVYKVVIWECNGISLWKEEEALNLYMV